MVRTCDHVTDEKLDSGDSESCTGATIISARSSDLAKLNPKCHMNYSNYL